MTDELLAQLPITHDEHARALKDLVTERVMQNGRKDADARLGRSSAITEAEADARLASAMEKMDEADARLDAAMADVTPNQPKPTAKAKAKKEK